MANTTFSPKIFAKELLRKFDQKNVFARYVNSMYTGELKKAGDSVHVQIAPTITFTASSITGAGAAGFATGTGPGGVITSEDFVLTAENLVINKYTEKRLKISNFELTQSNIDIEGMLSDRAAVGMNNLMDTEIRDQILVTDIATIPAANKLYSGAPKADVSKTTIYGYVEEMRVALANQNVTDNLTLFVSPLNFSRLVQSGLLDATDSGLDVRMTGKFRMLGGVKVVETTALTASFEMIMMQEGAVNFVTQITESSLEKATDGFYSNLLFQVVYGGKIFSESAKAICVFYASA
jgi:hypothetical protein